MAGARQLMPGVYVQDVFPPPVPSFITGVPAFLGRAAKGSHIPQRLTLWPQFAPVFGDLSAGSAVGGAVGGFLGGAVRGFFENDGLLCYVVRVEETEPASAGLGRALTMLDDLDDIDLICAPDVTAPTMAMAMAMAMDEVLCPDASDLQPVIDVQQALLDHCRDRGDRFAILDAVPTLDPEVVTNQCRALASDEEASRYGALYYPWLWTGGGGKRPLPPCGHLAGIYSRTDRQVGVHKTPANEVVEGVVDLQIQLTERQVGDLYQQGVNCLRALPGRGIRLWGARTLNTDPAWRDMNARRLVGTIHRWIERFMTSLVYEPNDIRLWVRITRELTTYLHGLFQRGALQGRTADEAFFVKCDNETNPSEIIDAGIVVTQIGVAPTRPAEFIIIRTIHGLSGVTVSET